MIATAEFLAPRCIAIGFSSYAFGLFCQFKLMRYRYRSGCDQNPRNYPAFIKLCSFYHYYLFLPLSCVGLLGASLFFSQLILNNTNIFPSTSSSSSSFSSSDFPLGASVNPLTFLLSVVKNHFLIPSAMGLASLVSASALILADSEQSGPAAVICALLAGFLGVASPVFFNGIGSFFGGEEFQQLMFSLSAVSLAPIVLFSLLWGRAAASD